MKALRRKSKDRITDEARYRLCIQCMEEAIARAEMLCGWKWKIEERGYLLDMEDAVRKHLAWGNLLPSDSGSVSYSDYEKLCSWCPYALEHIALASKELKFCSE